MSLNVAVRNHVETCHVNARKWAVTALISVHVVMTCENQPNEAPETIGVANSSDREDLDHDDLSDSSCAGESDVDIQL